jgi:threonine/homoserine/homoserine lactone efflux protein
VWSQVLVLGAVTIAIGTVLDVSYGVFGGLVRSRLARRGGHGPSRGRIAVGLTYIGLGGLTAATGQRAA